jgi:hypothetical protein
MEYPMNRNTDPTGVVAGEFGFHPGEVHGGPPQRLAGATLPPTDETAEAVRTRGERHIEMDGGQA